MGTENVKKAVPNIQTYTFPIMYNGHEKNFDRIPTFIGLGKATHCIIGQVRALI